jgi:hypothetical protein
MISLDSILPFCFIFDNIFFIHETLDWAKRFKQLAIVFKLDFSKAYNKIDLDIFYSNC